MEIHGVVFVTLLCDVGGVVATLPIGLSVRSRVL